MATLRRGHVRSGMIRTRDRTLGDEWDNERMRRVLAVIAVAWANVAILAGVSPTWAAAPAAATTPLPVPTPQTATTVCQIAEDHTGAVDITGLIATDSGYVVIDGSNQDWPPYIVHLNASCQRTRLQSYSGSPVDPEDLAIDNSGTLWIADTGDPTTSRTRVTLWRVPPSGPMTQYRLRYPDGAHQSEAMVLDGDGRPVLITQPSTGTGPAQLYEPAAGRMQTGVTATLVDVGSFTPEVTGTPNKLGVLGNLLVTGGANSPDGTRVVLRTFSDAYEWKVRNGDVVTAITKTTPLITPLANEEQGTSIAYSRDGKYFLTVSNVSVTTPILRYVPTVPAPAPKPTPVITPARPSGLRSWFNALSLSDLRAILITIAVLSAALIAAGGWGIYASRRANGAGTDESDEPDQATEPAATARR
jgi:hypothetical protein